MCLVTVFAYLPDFLPSLQGSRQGKVAYLIAVPEQSQRAALVHREPKAEF